MNAQGPSAQDRLGAVLRGLAERAASPSIAVPLAAVVALVVAVLHVRNAAGAQQPPPFGWFHFADFRDTVWLPTRDLLGGNDPYDLPRYLQRNPGAQEFPLYAPSVLVVGLLFAPLPLWAAMAVWAVVLVAALAVVARIALRLAGAPTGAAPVALLVALVVLTPPGRQALSSGQVAIPAAAACLVALTSDHRWVRAVAVAVALVKPQVGIPLLGVLLVVGRWRAVRDGVVIATVVSLPVAGLLAVRAGGVPTWVGTLVDNLDLSFSSPATSASRAGSTRIDLAGLLSRLGADLSTTGTLVLTLVVLAGALVVLRLVHRSGRRSEFLVACAATGALVLAAPTELYAYLVALPAVVAGLAVLVDRSGAGGWRSALPGLLLLVPFVHVTTITRAVGIPELTVLNTTAIVLGALVLPLVDRAGPPAARSSSSPGAGNPVQG